MRKRPVFLAVFPMIAALAFQIAASAQNAQDGTKATWPDPVWNRPPIAPANRKPAPKRNLTGMWGTLGAASGTQAGGVQLKPNNGRPENALPYTPYGLEQYKSHKALEGVDAVLPAQTNDPRNKCEPLGIPRYNHYNLRLTQIFQDDYKVAILYHYDNRWRIIWTDGRPLPKVLDGTVELDGQIREQRFFGYSVGKWLDDYTFQADTVGTMPEDRVWLDSTGRPISDQIHVTETFHRISADEMEWSETIDDPKIYTKPWETMKMPLRLQDPRTDIMEYYCSPVEAENYNKRFGSAASPNGK
ncbi:MAG TPA: hypothetical protein VN976_23430 [Verrucomicrobiae bacterium]|nr:hypothetical protein [Verrucomicrobiae bacterium]